MNDHPPRTRRGPLTRNAVGPSSAEAFVMIAIATILLTRLYLELTGYPQIGGGDLHIAHALWGGALMALSAVGFYVAFGFNVFTMFPISFAGLGAVLALAAGQPDEPKAHF